MWRVPWSFPHGFCLKVQEDLDWECGVCFWCLPKRMTAIDLQVRGMMCVGSSTSSISLKIENNGIFLSTSWSCKISPAAFGCINSILYTLSSQLPAYWLEICTSKNSPNRHLCILERTEVPGTSVDRQCGSSQQVGKHPQNLLGDENQLGFLLQGYWYFDHRL